MREITEKRRFDIESNINCNARTEVSTFEQDVRGWNRCISPSGVSFSRSKSRRLIRKVKSENNTNDYAGGTGRLNFWMRDIFNGTCSDNVFDVSAFTQSFKIFTDLLVT